MLEFKVKVIRFEIEPKSKRKITMPQITKVEIEKAYELARIIYQQDISQTEARDVLIEKFNMNPSSAYGYIRAISSLFRGGLITRTINTSAVEYILENVADDLGTAVANNVVQGLWLHIEYYEKKTRGIHKALRQILSSHVQEKENNSFESVVEFNERVIEAALLDQNARMQKIELADKKPKCVVVQTVGYTRNQHIVAERLFRANGKCDHCGNTAPFIRKTTRKPYLEVHHIIPLAEGGYDELENTMALCPNCHREAHLGIDWKKFRLV